MAAEDPARTDRGLSRWRASVSALFAVAAVLAAAWAALIALSGGFALKTGLSARNASRPLFVAAALLAIAWIVDRRSTRRVLAVIAGGRAQAAVRLALAAAAAVFVTAVAWNSAAAGGSDSSCYMLQAVAFREGQIALREPLAREIPIARPDAFFAPTGFLASPVERGAAVPICGPGLAIAMAAASLAGGATAVALVVPACAALLAWFAFVLARRLDDEVCGVVTAVLVAASPIVIYQAVQPMSDIPAAALWVGAVAAAARRDARGAALAGLLGSAAVLVRPNLALPVAALAAFVVGRQAQPGVRLRAIAAFAVAALPCAIVLAWLNAERYGSPLVSGYGETSALFAWVHVGPNATRYARWLMWSETPVVVFALGAPYWAWRRRRDAALVAAMGIGVVLIAGTYLAYSVFDDWWYVRFLLPAIPLLLAMAVAVLLAVVPRPRARLALAVFLILGLVPWYLRVAAVGRAFDLHALESRFVKTGAYVDRATPASAVVLSVQQSGAVRYHGGRLSGMWDQLEPGELDGAIAWLERRGRPVFIALEDAELSRFRARFGAQQFGQLDWPPRAEIHGPIRVMVYAAGDRARYRRGEALIPEYVR